MDGRALDRSNEMIDRLEAEIDQLELEIQQHKDAINNLRDQIIDRGNRIRELVDAQALNPVVMLQRRVEADLDALASSLRSDADALLRRLAGTDNPMALSAARRGGAYRDAMRNLRQEYADRLHAYSDTVLRDLAGSDNAMALSAARKGVDYRTLTEMIRRFAKDNMISF